MSAIDELNDSLVINASGKNITTKEADNGVTIDATGEEIKTKVTKPVQINPPTRHKFIKQEMKRTPESAGGKKIIKSEPVSARKVVSQSAIPVQPEKSIQEVHVSPMDDMVGIDNPNSLLSKWVKEKDQEAREWIAEKEEEKAVLESEDGDDTLSGTIGNSDFEIVQDKRILVEDDDLILDLTSKNKEEEISYPNKYDIQSKLDEIFRSNDFIYKKKLFIKTKYSEKYYMVISKSYDYLLTIDGEKIYIDNILEIRL